MPAVFCTEKSNGNKFHRFVNRSLTATWTFGILRLDSRFACGRWTCQFICASLNVLVPWQMIEILIFWKICCQPTFMPRDSFHLFLSSLFSPSITVAFFFSLSVVFSFLTSWKQYQSNTRLLFYIDRERKLMSKCDYNRVVTIVRQPSKQLSKRTGKQETVWVLEISPKRVIEWKCLIRYFFQR